MIIKIILCTITFLSFLGMFSEEGKKPIYGVVTSVSLVLLTALELLL